MNTSVTKDVEEWNAETLYLARAVGVGFRHADARHAALYGGIDGRVALAPVVERAAHGAAIMQRHRHKDGYAREDNQSQDGVDPQ